MAVWTDGPGPNTQRILLCTSLWEAQTLCMDTGHQERFSWEERACICAEAPSIFFALGWGMSPRTELNLGPVHPAVGAGHTVPLGQLSSTIPHCQGKCPSQDLAGACSAVAISRRKSSEATAPEPPLSCCPVFAACAQVLCLSTSLAPRTLVRILGQKNPPVLKRASNNSRDFQRNVQTCQ